MTDKEQKIAEELQKCRENIRRTKELIAYHRDILKKQERKADELSARLDKEKMKSLFSLIHESGYDIDVLRQAVSAGQVTGISDVQKSAVSETSESAVSAAKNSDDADD